MKFKPKKQGLFQTPYCLTSLILDKVKLKGDVLEPARGKDAIVKVLLNYVGPVIFAYDKKDNFFKQVRKVNNIITNPPLPIIY